MLFHKVSRHVAQRNPRKSFLLYNQVRGKSVQNWKRPTMDEYLGPKEYWDRANAKRQVINNFYFGSGFGFFTFTCFYSYSLDLLVPPNVDPYKVPLLTQNLVKPSSVIEEDDQDDDNNLDEEEIVDDTIETVDVFEAFETETPIEEENEVPADEIKPPIEEKIVVEPLTEEKIEEPVKTEPEVVIEPEIELVPPCEEQIEEALKTEPEVVIEPEKEAVITEPEITVELVKEAVQPVEEKIEEAVKTEPEVVIELEKEVTPPSEEAKAEIEVVNESVTEILPIPTEKVIAEVEIVKPEVVSEPEIKAESEAVKPEVEVISETETEIDSSPEEDKVKVEAKQKAVEVTIQENARFEAEANAKAEAEAEEIAAKLKAEAIAIAEAEEKTKLEAEENAKLEAETKAKAEEKAILEAEAKAEAEEAILEAEAEAEAKAIVEAEEKAKLEAEEKAILEAEAKAEEKAQKQAEAEEKAKFVAEVKAKEGSETEVKSESESVPEESTNVNEVKVVTEEKLEAVIKDIPPVKAASTKPIPEEVTYLLIGGGTASFAAGRAIRINDIKSKILIVSEENHLPYRRPPLSKELWYDDKTHTVKEGELMFKSMGNTDGNLFFEKPAWFTPLQHLDSKENGGISVLKGNKVVSIDSENQIATLENGHKIRYQKCLIATGGQPKTLEAFTNIGPDHVTTYHNVQDFMKMEALIANKKIDSVAIIGGGLLGTELAYSMALQSPKTGLKITQILKEKGHLTKILPEYLSNWITNKMRSEGVQVFEEATVKSASLDDQGKVNVTTNSGKTVKVDHVVLAIGISPNAQLAESAGLEKSCENGGLIANEKLETNKKNIFVAGDVASYYDPLLGKQKRVEHHDNAFVTGKLAGQNMTGESKGYKSQEFFWSDLGFAMGIEAVGKIDSSLETVGIYTMDDKDEFDRGVVFYQDKNEVVIGVLLWNVFNHISTARRVVAENRKYNDLTEVAKLFNMYKGPSQGISEDPNNDENTD